VALSIDPFTIAIDANNGWRSVKVLGRNKIVGTSYEPVAPGGVYPTPQPDEALPLRIRAGGDADDSADGTGARRIELQGLGINGYEIIETLDTAGTAASQPTLKSFLRLYRARVVLSGTYATQTQGSHAADITIEDTDGQLFTIIPVDGFPESTARIGAFTTPANYEGYLIGFRINAQAQKLVDAITFSRSGVLEEVPPYSPMTAEIELFNINGFIDLSYDAPLYLPPLTDVGVMAKVGGQTAQINSGLGLLLRRIL